MQAAGGFTVKEETVEDARLAVVLLGRQLEVDKTRVFVLGHSLGGMLAPRIAAGNAGVAGLIVLAGNTRPLEVLVLDQMHYLAGLDAPVTEAGKQQIAAAERTVREVQDPNLKPGMTVDFIGIPTPASYFLDLRAYRPAVAAAALSIPMLIMRGDRDYQVTNADFQGWTHALAGHAAVTFKLYPGLDHLFIAGIGPSKPADALTAGHVALEVVRDIAAWVQDPNGALK
jgi:dienelactone hydrolase